MSNSRSNYPQTQLDELQPEYVRNTIENLQDIANLGRITRSADMDATFEERVQIIIDFCREKGMRLGIETLCAGLGISRQELHNWENGVGAVTSRRADAVKRVKQLIFSFIEQCGLSGRINPTTYIWITKNWAGYRDAIELMSVPDNNTSEPAVSMTELEKLRESHLIAPEKPEL